jgi:hypothetical protein
MHQGFANERHAGIFQGLPRRGVTNISERSADSTTASIHISRASWGARQVNCIFRLGVQTPDRLFATMKADPEAHNAAVAREILLSHGHFPHFVKRRSSGTSFPIA